MIRLHRLGWNSAAPCTIDPREPERAVDGAGPVTRDHAPRAADVAAHRALDSASRCPHPPQPWCYLPRSFFFFGIRSRARAEGALRAERTTGARRTAPRVRARPKARASNEGHKRIEETPERPGAGCGRPRHAASARIRTRARASARGLERSTQRAAGFYARASAGRTPRPRTRRPLVIELRRSREPDGGDRPSGDRHGAVSRAQEVDD